MIRECDVVVLGGGPSGLAAAARLAQLGKGVQVWTRRPPAGPRVGESIGPEVRELLERYGLGEGFNGVPHREFVGVRVAWGSAEPYERPGMINPLGLGRHIDRLFFDRWLEKAARRSGAEIYMAAGGIHCGLVGGKWIVRDRECNVAAPFLIDARGRNSPVSGPRRTWIAFDRLIGIVRWFKVDAGNEPDLLIESTPNGWWYSAYLPQGKLAATFMTDSDLIPRGLEAAWHGALADAPYTGERLAMATATRRILVRRADSGYSHPDRGANWISVGDAAFARDPLAGTGILSALRSGFQAAEGPTGGKEAASSQLNYLEERARYYGRETRWPNSLFWARRSNPKMDEFRCRLDPSTTLKVSARPANEYEIAKAEGLLPYRLIAALLRRLEHQPMRAHEAAAFLREVAGPLNDGLLIGGVQHLAECGVLDVLG